MHDLIVCHLIKCFFCFFNCFKRCALYFSSCLLRWCPGSNLVRTAIHHALARIFETDVNSGGDAYIEELFVQVDNCVGENKNHILVGYLGSLVGRVIIVRLEINLMMMGHTHIKIDRSTRSSQGQIFCTSLLRTIARRSACVRAEILFLLKIYHPPQAPVKNRNPG